AGFRERLGVDRGNALSVALSRQCRTPAQQHRRAGCRQGNRARPDRAVKLIFSERAWGEYLHWQAEDEKLLTRLNTLLKECMRDPFRGTGKPEPLGGNLSGWWSRRINQEHRLIY